MSTDGLLVQRYLSVAAATLVAISCGTNYAYSAWAPQFADRLHLTSTQLNMIGNAATVGMYGCGIPLGMLVDRKGPRIAGWIGGIMMGMSYYVLWAAYSDQPQTYSTMTLCIAGLMTGLGSSSGSVAAIKTCATNWPHHRGAATALPLGAFGLSAFAYTSISGLIFPNDAGHLLWFLTVGTFTTVMIGTMFLRLLSPPPSEHIYTSLSGKHTRSVSITSSTSPPKPLRHRTRSSIGNSSDEQDMELHNPVEDDEQDDFSGDESSLVSLSESDIRQSRKESRDEPVNNFYQSDIKGLALLQKGQFWTLFILLGLLCGVGLMTINNVGTDVRTLWHHWDKTFSSERIHQGQLLHVSILSVCSFLGRLCSGFGSDILVRRYNSTRFWLLVVSASFLVTAQIFALSIENPHHIYLLSGFTGFGYGTLFGVYPAIVADTFGAAGLGINWGAMTLSPVISGNLFNLIYGKYLDANSDHPEGSERVCLDGRRCYASAYKFTLVSTILGLIWAIICVMRDLRDKKSL